MIGLIAALTISPNLAQTPAGLDADMETALGTAGLTLRTAVLDENLLRIFRQGEHATPFYLMISESPWRVPMFAETIRREMSAQGGKPSDALMTVARLAGFGTRRTLLGNPIARLEEAAKKPDALQSVLDTMRAQKLIVGKTPSFAEVPAEVRQAAALVLLQVLESRAFRKTAFADIPDLAASRGAMASRADGVEAEAAQDALARKVDLRHLAAGAHDLLLAAQTAQVLTAAIAPTQRYRFEIETAWGLVRLSGGTDETHPNTPTLLVIDTGGDDTYLGLPANSTASNWASVVIDQAGNDRYLSHADLAAKSVAEFEGRRRGAGKGPGSAFLGYSCLIDARGNDLYRSHREGLGSATFGVASVLDREGDDNYDGYRNSIGYGEFGVGIVEDMLGNDVYRGFSQVQGIGQTGGAGLVVDRAGSDRYIADDETIDFPSPQSDKHNVSMAQGAGNGRRSDYTTGHSLAGGVGILYDVSGDDEYTCGVFGQGVGYWMGVGMLWDSAGSDRYLGQWYAQGASAHFAIGYLEDELGNDRYTAPMNMAQGAGHDFSIGALVERDGDDTYVAPNLSLGAGNANGIGMLLELNGNDSYTSGGWTLGKGADAPKGSLRSRAFCFGLFIDFRGKDTYPAQATWAKDGARTANWTDKGPSPSESQLGVFWDR